MSAFSWSNWWRTNTSTARSGRARIVRPHVETLEDRSLLSTFHVLNLNDGGPDSLRQAIHDANATPNVGGPDVIAFNIAGGGAQSIALFSRLPDITDAVILDGTTQPGFDALNPQPMIELNGAWAGFGTTGLTLAANDSVVRGLAINRFNGHGLHIRGSGGNRVEGNYIGLDLSGTVALANGGSGVVIDSGAWWNTVGGSDAGTRNVISGNGADGVQLNGGWTAGNTVQGNYIGTDATGTAARGNFYAGVAMFFATHDNLVAGNLISGNNGNGLFFGNFGPGGAHHNQVRDNSIGTDATGTVALGNAFQGVEFNDAHHNLIADNVIAGNHHTGVFAQNGASGNVVQGNFIGTNEQGTALGNANGLYLIGFNNLIGGDAPGTGNVIAFNERSGIIVGGGEGNAIRGNSVFGNAFLGIDLGDDGVTANDSVGHFGPNRFQNYPTLTSTSNVDGVVTVQGTLTSTPNTTFTLDVFASAASNSAQGQTYLGSTTVTTDGDGNGQFIFSTALMAGQEFFTATATDPSNNTSEFSREVSVLTVNAHSVKSTAGAPFSGIVAAFTNPTAAGALSATIHWGDGTSSPGQIQADGSGFVVKGDHTYAADGNYTVTVDLDDHSARTATVHGTAKVNRLGRDIQRGQTETPAFWNSRKGQALLKSFNGGPSAQDLSNWLASSFTNLFGAGAGASNLTGKTNAQVAEYFQQLFDADGRQLEKHVLTVALNVYATTRSLGGDAATTYGFNVTAQGLGAASVNVGRNGDAFGVANCTRLNVYQLLKAADASVTDGVLYGGNKKLRNKAQQVFRDVNHEGDC